MLDQFVERRDQQALQVQLVIAVVFTIPLLMGQQIQIRELVE